MVGLTVFEHCWQDVDNIGFVSFVRDLPKVAKQVQSLNVRDF